MKSIVSYTDFRQYISDFYEERKRTSAFSWREFNKLAGYTSPNYLKLVCDGKSKLSKTKVELVAKAMNLAGYELTYFDLMVSLDNAKEASQKKEILLEMDCIAKEHKARIVDSDAFEFYQSWEYPVIRELAPMMPGAKPHELAAACNEDISAEDVSRILKFLVKRGFLKSENGNYTQTEKTVIASKEALPLAIRSMHREMANYAEKAVDKYSVEERHFMGITMGVNAELYGKVVAELEDCCRRINAITADCDNLDQVYRMNIQFFPFTKKV
ncbi:MAG: TIGR02147 family protein [Fibrobacter sp.]|nr:TIGR02147 family protein [Fibrobacter sp.]